MGGSKTKKEPTYGFSPDNDQVMNRENPRKRRPSSIDRVYDNVKAVDPTLEKALVLQQRAAQRRTDGSM